MNSPTFPSAQTQPTSAPTRVPRIDSLLHRLQHTHDPEGNPLLDALLFLLDDPPAGTRDRWQAGADFCAEHGIETARVSVWRLYRAQITQWRREQNPPSPEPAPGFSEIALLELQVRHLAAQRLIEMLNDPRLTPTQLVGIVRNDLAREKLRLALDQFDDKLATRKRHEDQQERDRVRRSDERVYANALHLSRIKRLIREEGDSFRPIPPHST